MHVFTTMDLDYDAAIAAFQDTFADPDSKVVLTADVPYAAHVERMYDHLKAIGYTGIFAAEIVHNPSSSIPNRTVPTTVSEDPTTLSQWSLFHISDPPTSLLLSLTSQMSKIRVYSTTKSEAAISALERSTQLLLRRRYALVSSLNAVGIWGILINTLSVANYLPMITHIQSQLTAAGKKSYLFVVGKLNPAKIANFSEIGGWVVVGCWESSLVDSKDFYAPVITPFELELCLQGDERVWTGEWKGDFGEVLKAAGRKKTIGDVPTDNDSMATADSEDGHSAVDTGSDEESEPPEFDLRTGRYVSRSRPLRNIRQTRNLHRSVSGSRTSTALTKRNRGDLISINGVNSPAAEYLAQKRTWQGLGTDFKVEYEDEEIGSAIEEGRSGVARGYTVGESVKT
jgi:diphthamide biosynthesis protein 2